MIKIIVAALAISAASGAAFAASAVNLDSETRSIVVTEGGSRQQIDIGPGETVDFCANGCFVTLPNGDPFPYRDLILFVAFGVIFVTLVGTGLTLPPVVRWLGVAKNGRSEHVAEHEAELAARRQALQAALASLDAMTDDRELSEEVIKLLRMRHETRSNQLPEALDPDPDTPDVTAVGIDLTRELIGIERQFIHALLRDGKITDEARRHIERDLDLEEASLANREYRVIP